MPYTPQSWADNDPSKPLSAARMTVIENGVQTAQSTAEAAAAGPPQGAAGGDLAGSYPNPTIKATLTDPAPATAGLRTLGTGAQQATAGNDARLSNSRTPTTHGTTHGAAGSDPVAIAASQLTATGTPSTSTFLRGDNSWATPAGGGGGGAGSDTTALHYLQYDTTGATTGHTALQAAIDAGERNIFIPPGVFLCGGAVFYDQEDGNATLRLNAPGVVFRATTSLPTSAEFESYCTANSIPTGCKWFIFPSTKRTALSGGVVTGTGNNVTGTATIPTGAGARNGMSPHLVVDGGSWDASLITNFNAGFVFGNVGGSSELRSMHLGNARHLLSWTGYVDANKVMNCAAWSNSTLDQTYNHAIVKQIDSGDALYILGCKAGNYYRTADLTSCNGAYINSVVAGSVKLTNCHGIHIDANHTELASNIFGSGAPSAYVIRDSHVSINTSFDYLPDNTTQGAVYVDDTNSEGRHSTIQLSNYFGRQYISTSDVSDPTGGYAIYINKMNDRTKIHVINSYTQMSASGTFGQAYGQMGLTIGGNATNEPTLAAAVATGRDFIGSGTFTIYKYATSTVSTGQNVAMTIGVGTLGNLGGLYRSRLHVTPTKYDSENYGAGTLTSGTVYAYAAAVCNTLPDGSIQYGAATAEWTQTAPAAGAQGFELYMPSAANGATLVIWRKTTTGVLATPDRYVVLPVMSAATRMLDTGANINKLPWITTSVPVPNTVAATNHTAEALYQGTTNISSGGDPTMGGDLTGTASAAQIASGVIVNADVNATAAIAESKLSLASDAAAGTASRRTLGTGATQAAAGNDSRFTDARTPTAHASTHTAGGSDAVSIAASQMTATGTPSSTTYLRGDNTWATPAGGGGGSVASDTIWDTKGDLAVATAADTASKLAVGSSLTDRLVADSAASTGLKWVPHVVRRSTDASNITSNTTLANDSALLWAIAANEVWSFMAVVIFTAANTTMDAKIGWSVPSGCTMTWGALGGQANNIAGFGPVANTTTPLALLTESQNLQVGTLNGTSGVNLQGVVANSTTAGNVNIQFAQAGSDAGALTPKANSHLILWRLA